MPTVLVAVRIEAAGPVAGLSLEVRLRIHAERRRHTAGEAERLRELFGAPEDWARSLGAIPWAEASRQVPGFTGAAVVELAIPCTYDFEVAAAKYLAALEGGEVPVELLFSGRVFFAGEDGRLQMAMVPWDRDAAARMPVAVWREAVRASFGDCGWVRLHRDVLARLQAERSRRGLTSWEATIEALLEAAP